MSRESRELREQRIAKERAIERASYEASKGPMDMPFLILVLLLTGIGLVMVLSASFPSAYYDTGDPLYFFKQQVMFAVLGLAFMLWIGKWNYARFRAFSRIAIIVSFALLIAVFIPGVGHTHEGATRWIKLGSFGTFQPSEVVKLAIVIYFADTISKKKDKMATFRYGIRPYIVPMGAIAILMMLEPHFSGTVLILGIGAVMMFVGGIQLKWVWAGLGAIATVAVGFLTGIIKYNSSRITIWLDPFNEEYALNKGYQMIQSLLSIGSGGLLGVGLGKSRQKFLFLPEEHNDFIFAIVCEELGLIGATLIMLLYAALILRGYWIALRARDRFGSLLAVGVTTQIALQTFLNIAVVSGLIPNTGISLPFFSYGGTALFLQLVGMGIVLSVSRQIPAPRSGG